VQVSALRARHDRAGLSLAQDRGGVGRRAAALATARQVRAAGRDIQVVDDRADHVGVLDRSCDPMAVVDEEPEAEHDEHPAREQRDLRDKRRLRILMRDEEDEADVHERAHEQADRDLGDPVLQEPVEQARAEQRRDHRQHQQRDRKNQR
jgi:hypothetical protein